MKILSVDDSKVMRMIISNAVDLLDYDFLEAQNGKEALKILEDQYKDIKLILIDWNMPEMNGPELIENLKNDERYKSIPFMMVTTENERLHIIQAVKAGAKNYVTKPFTQQDLTVKIMETLNTDL
ncbi:MAG: response regulator [Candidatus Zixiibacteriota bacterium]